MWRKHIGATAASLKKRNTAYKLYKMPHFGYRRTNAAPHCDIWAQRGAGCSRRRHFFESAELHAASLSFPVDVLLSNVKATKAPSSMLQTAPISKLQCPTNGMLKGLSLLIDCLRRDGFDFSLSPMQMHFTSIFDSRKQNYLLVRRTQMIVIKHIS